MSSRRCNAVVYHQAGRGCNNDLSQSSRIVKIGLGAPVIVKIVFGAPVFAKIYLGAPVIAKIGLGAPVIGKIIRACYCNLSLLCLSCLGHSSVFKSREVF